MEHLNAYPPGTINFKPLRNQTPESWALKGAIAKTIYDKYGIPCWVSSTLQKYKDKDGIYYPVYLFRMKDKSGKECLCCSFYLEPGFYKYAEEYGNPKPKAHDLKIEGYPAILKLIDYTGL